jgi:hypothetical protein
MAKNLRADIDESEFHRFKRIKAELGASTNDAAIVKLMNRFEDQKSKSAKSKND